jgi:steroid Delta-isomerase
MPDNAKMPDSSKMTATVHAYVEGFAKGDAAHIAALFAENATVEDPIGSPIHHGRTAIQAFYTTSMATGAKLTINGPIRIAADHAAFAFSVNLHFAGSDKRVDVIDTFRFNDQNEITEMRAYWGPENMHGF